MKPSKLVALLSACAMLVAFSSCFEKPQNIGGTLDISQIGSHEEITTSDSDSSSEQQTSSDIETEQTDTSTSSKQNSDKKPNTTDKKPETNAEKPVSSSSVPSTEQTTIIPQKPSQDQTTTSPNKPEDTPNKVVIPNLIGTTNKNKNLTPVSVEDYYGWSWLKKNGTEAERDAYRLFVSEIGKYNSVIEFDFNISRDEAERAFNIYKSDYPQHFWRGTNYTVTLSGKKIKSMSFNNPLYNGNVTKIKTLKQELDKKIESVLSKLNDDMSDFEKELVIHNYIVENTDYAEGENSHNMAGPLVDGIAVCEGYSLAFQYLMRQAGVPCITVLGNLNGISHMWNMPQIEGSYYHIDVTADDPVMDTGDEVLTFNYFNLTDSDIEKDHDITGNAIKIPSANMKKCEYFTKTNQVYDSFTVDNFAYSIALAYKNGLEYASLRFESVSVSDSDKFIEQNYYAILDRTNQILGSNVFSASGSISYNSDKERNILNLKTNY